MAHNKTSRRISTLGSRFTSMISVCLVLLLLGIGAMAGLIGNGIAGEVRRNVGFVVKLERDCSDDNIRAIATALESHPAVASAEFLSADSILAEESKFLGESLSDDVNENPFFPEFNVNLEAGATAPDSVAAITAYFESIEGVGEIVSENAVIEGVDKALRRTGTFALIGAAALLMVAIALINNTVSLSIYSRRNTIHTMKLVGATRGFIRAPFVRSAALNGLVAGVIASGLLAFLRIYAATFDPIVGASLPWVEMAILFLGLLAIGTALCALTAAFAINRHLNSSYEDLFLK
ncbi:MAG: permease-like cell division protein FtsX [Muribaculaceae bacterium]|nr:permease-like cell division protein FtsX [Muribaculaceae bacterium]